MMRHFLSNTLGFVVMTSFLLVMMGSFVGLYRLFQSEKQFTDQLATQMQRIEVHSQTAVFHQPDLHPQTAVSPPQTEVIIVQPIPTDRPAESAFAPSRHQSDGELSAISPIFSKEVRYWEDRIVRWADQYQLDPDIIATIMQIESCGHPQARSSAGAMGLFQVMPHHFLAEETAVDPNTNAHRGLSYLNAGLTYHNGDLWRAMAGYNAGHGNVLGPIQTWPKETQTYHFWGKGIYEDAKSGVSTSPILQAWFGARGDSLCWQAARWLDL